MKGQEITYILCQTAMQHFQPRNKDLTHHTLVHIKGLKT